ncbi:NAD(P)-binding protein [Punctularia strigosozonata HHB-11173 SS5]|uniref:NAD(P)-binding protein n=1 Tax=Punctularia strigosozonata (strain HHB-11173) TaxID=741275 RepID=UPI0004417A1F|nr:NAD(P)-binding protein [Punctularia strigosozonata HHB-11173 SS5]EIN10542.1 NAD(P)-binding protein [Punctularia strigosozonata HHB-11173 SS5]
MAPITNRRVLFNEIPTGYPDPEKTVAYDESQVIDVDGLPLEKGAFILKTLVLSIDPYLRGRMRDASKESYSPAFRIGEPISNFGVGVVVRSENPEVQVGDHLYGFYTFEEYIVRNDASSFKKIKGEVSWSAFVGVAGMPGKTAYYGYKEFYTPKKGDVAFVSGGAGPVGSFVAQLAKLDGLKVIASAGSDEKVNFLKEIGVDVAFNYKTTSTKDVLTKEGPINLYWDNVGGETLEAAFEAAALNATFIECGMISAYNGESYPVKNLFQIIAKRLRIFGLLVGDLEEKYHEEFYHDVVPGLIGGGKIKYTEDIREGLHTTGQGIYDVQTGGNTAKLVIRVAKD